MESHLDVAVVGSGPAGCTAALYLARAEKQVTVFEGPVPGGSMTTTSLVENFPGFDSGVLGPDLMQTMRSQAERFGARFLPSTVTRIVRNDGGFTITTDLDDVSARAVVLATGSLPRMLGIPREKELLGRGVSTCATCDGYFFRNQSVVVVGGGDSAMEEAIALAELGCTVTLVHRREELRASSIMQSRAQSHRRITFVLSAEVTALHGEDLLTGVAITNIGDDSDTRLIEATGLFVAIGSTPQSSLVCDPVALADATPDGHVRTTARTTRTNTPGLFACGDLIDPHYRQAIVAAGSGCTAALDAVHYLQHNVAAQQEVSYA